MFKASTLKKYIPINKRINISQNGEEQTLSFMLDLDFKPTYIESIVAQKIKNFNWFIDCEKLDLFTYIPAKADICFFVTEITTDEQKKYEFMTHQLIMICHTYKPSGQMKTCTYITLDTQITRNNDENRHVQDD